MAIDLTLDPGLTALRDRTAAFVRDTVVPAEWAMLHGSGSPDDAPHVELQQAACWRRSRPRRSANASSEVHSWSIARRVLRSSHNKEGAPQ